jgi:hypothetical protein
LNSHTESEWKTGLIELDNFIRMALIDQGYVGSTTLELLKDAKEKGHQFIKNAEDIAYLRQRLKSAGNRFDFTHEDIQLLVDKFTDFKNTIIPEEDRGHNSHGHETHASH